MYPMRPDKIAASPIKREIDLLVYELYGLTEEEIKIVEDSTRPVEGASK